MNQEAEKKLNSIIAKDVLALTNDDVLFLKARSSYLTSDQKDKFKSVLKDTPKQKEEDKKPEEGIIDLKELKVRGEAVGVKYKIGIKKEVYLKMVEEAEQANQPK